MTGSEEVPGRVVPRGVYVLPRGPRVLLRGAYVGSERLGSEGAR